MPDCRRADARAGRRTRRARRSSASPPRSRPTAPSSSPRATAPRSAMTGGPQAALWASSSSTSPASPSPGGSTRAAAACSRHRARHDGVTPRPRAGRSTGRISGDRDEPFPRSPHLLQAHRRRVRRRPWHRHQRGPALGGRLSQALAARQDRALHARRELHRLVLVEDLRQGRHRHLGDAADRLSAHAAGPAEPRAARLLARRQLQLVSLFRATA